VPLPKLPGAENQTPTEELDQLFTALKKWVEDGTEPGEIIIASRDGTVSYPICIYAKKTAYKGEPKTSPSSYACE